MGTDLTLCPVKWHTVDRWLLYDRIQLDRNYELFEAIKAQTHPRLLSGSALPAYWYGDEGLEKIDTDAYGEPLTYLLPRDFQAIESAHSYNQAVIEFMRSLPEDMPIVLYWN